jgi:hypothetical protein
MRLRLIFAFSVLVCVCGCSHGPLATALPWREDMLSGRTTEIPNADRGSQYVDNDYIEVLKAHGVDRSMSRVSNCYDDAFIESFWSTLKSDTGFDTPASQHREPRPNLPSSITSRRSIIRRDATARRSAISHPWHSKKQLIRRPILRRLFRGKSNSRQSQSVDEARRPLHPPSSERMQRPLIAS